MTKLIVPLMLSAAVGCVHVQPVGPLAEALGQPTNPPPPGAGKAAAVVPAVEPVIRDAPKPVPPAMYVTPGEVSAANADDAVKRLQQELETDRRGAEAMPRYSEVTRVSGG